MYSSELVLCTLTGIHFCRGEQQLCNVGQQGCSNYLCNFCACAVICNSLRNWHLNTLAWSYHHHIIPDNLKQQKCMEGECTRSVGMGTNIMYNQCMAVKERCTRYLRKYEKINHVKLVRLDTAALQEIYAFFSC